MESLVTPVYQIAENAGYDPGIVEKQNPKLILVNAKLVNGLICLNLNY